MTGRPGVVDTVAFVGANDRELDDMLQRWRALDDEGVDAIVVEWPVPTARRPRRRQLSR